ncbi:MAG: GNAT family N-acetyltransferase [Planctomycetota bacterium]|nr:GNAT family N-acetyltransferase [Planctomycetota bacterium]
MSACDFVGPTTPRPARADWTIRPYQPGDERQLVGLFQTCFHRPITEAHWRWKLRGFDTSIDNVWVAEADGRIIGHYGGMPVRIWLSGQEHRAMVAVDSMLHPGYQGRWVFMKLLRQAHQVWRSSGVTFWLGLPNENWGAARKKRLGIQDVFSLNWKIRPFHIEHLLARRCQLPWPRSWTPLSAVWNRFWDGKRAIDRKIELIPVTQVTPEFDALWQSARPHLRVSIIRDANWVQWRFLASPDRQYQVLLAARSGTPVGYAAYRIEEQNSRLALLAELFVDPSCPQSYPGVLGATVRHFRQLGVDAAVTLAIPQTSTARLLDQAGFRFGRGGSFGVSLLPLADHLDQAVNDPQAWWMGGGDFDVI